MLKVLLVVACVVLVGVLVYLGGNIHTITVTGDFVSEPKLQQNAQECLKSMLGRNYWATPERISRSLIARCDVMFYSSTVQYHFPGRMNVNVLLIQPKVKVINEDKSCVVIEDSAKRAKLNEERCGAYVLPELIGTEGMDNTFVQEYATNLVDLLQEVGLKYKRIELKGEKIAYWYVVTLEDGVLVYLPSGTDARAKVTLLDAAIKGLNSAKERHSVIDMRFDMVTYR